MSVPSAPPPHAGGHGNADVMPSFGHEGGSAGRIGRYQIIKTLGEGSFGKVKLAYHMATHARVALKIINRKTLAKSDMQGRIEREISYLRLLRHPHIIKLYDVIKSKDEIVMVIEFAGNELFDYIVQRGKMREDEARRFFQQIISAVEYCHRHKIVHRDLKPENLLLDEDLNVKIADFGLSNIMTDGNFLKTSCGSPNYAAPEVISGKLYAGPEVDVWSCGVILYVMLCGRLPFDDEFIPVLFKKISGGVYTIPNFLSPGAKHLLQRMLVVNPLNRITVQEIIEDPWFKVGIASYLLPPVEQDDGNEDHKEGNDSKTATEKVDDGIVASLGKTMGYDKEQVYEALKSSDDNGSEIRDAYYLLKDNHQASGDIHFKKDDIDRYLSEHPEDADDLKQPFSRTSTPVLAATASSPGTPVSSSGKPYGRGNPPTLTFDKRFQGGVAIDSNSLTTPHTTIAILPTSLPAYHRANMIAEGIQPSKKLNPISTKKSKTRWHFGIRSRSYPLDVMGEIYRALRNLGAEWAKPVDDDLWTIHVRWKCGLPLKQSLSNSCSGITTSGESTPQTTAVNSGDVTPTEANNNTDTSVTPRETPKTELMKMRIQLYQLEQNNYLVDFKFDGWENPDGTAHPKGAAAPIPEFDSFSAYPFLHLATKLIMELAVNSQA
ncbi:AMP-activated serine/threonine-protein kinase catalytic subunit SNF1 [Sugiyamaella lignohabitans]|uniref:Carbon catabolite-derepressing protein kinase n=1 Tax=Sugiyamaella lignohabitans TaxID=796027 RepID=A0A167CKS8_9ASCO|nr:AMP-activated serine/threonine-protein kinase catalytic subunit SNF1 [Sugiyamaella lignohabitans]ANB11823.1 AMP-activated serine/threonine-protein kinase catalytic subunit SNF1 [Sugiyamaella lignohabitans]